jgi:hypothetical protein
MILEIASLRVRAGQVEQFEEKLGSECTFKIE